MVIILFYSLLMDADYNYVINLIIDVPNFNY